MNYGHKILLGVCLLGMQLLPALSGAQSSQQLTQSVRLIQDAAQFDFEQIITQNNRPWILGLISPHSQSGTIIDAGQEADDFADLPPLPTKNQDRVVIMGFLNIMDATEEGLTGRLLPYRFVLSGGMKAGQRPPNQQEALFDKEINSNPFNQQGYAIFSSDRNLLLGSSLHSSEGFSPLYQLQNG